jgi:hypothetical protein
MVAMASGGGGGSIVLPFSAGGAADTGSQTLSRESVQ